MAAGSAATPPYKLLGKGTYGLVFEPALPNVNAAGNPVEFPGYVTKAFFEEEEYKKALTNAPKLARNVPAIHIPYNSYTRKVQRGNIPLAVRKEAKNHGDLTDPMYLIRMPHKGYSIRDVTEQSAMRRKIEALPLEVKVREIYKLMNIVKALGDAGYVHGDIREPNILINPDAGTMTIIDFDLLKPTSEFAATFPVPYYHIPPEASVLLLRQTPAAGPFSPAVPSLWSQFLDDFVRKGKSIRTYIYRDIFDNTYYYPNGLAEFHFPGFHRETLEYVTTFRDALHSAPGAEEVETLRKHAEELMYRTVDSFSLAYCLRYLFSHLTLGGADDELKTFLVEELFPKMMSGNGAKRLRIEDAMREFREFAERSFGISLTAPTAAAAVDAVETEAARLAALAPAAAGAATLSDEEITREVQNRLRASNAASSDHEKDVIITHLMNFLLFNAIPFLEKHHSFRNSVIERCIYFSSLPIASAELKEACARLLAVIAPPPASAARSSRSAAAAAVAAATGPASATSSLNSARSLGSLRLSPASTKSKRGSAAAAAIGGLAAAAAVAAPAPPTPQKDKAKTRAQKRRERRRRAKTRAQAAAAAAGKA